MEFTASLARFAAIASAIIVGLSLLVWVIAGAENYPFGIMGWGSYVILVLGHGMMFFAIPAYRKELQAPFNMRAALSAALMLVALASLAYAFYMAIFMNFMGGAFLDYFVAQQKAALSAQEFKQFMEQLKAQEELFRSPLYHAGIAFVTSFALGFLLSVPAAWRLGRAR